MMEREDPNRYDMYDRISTALRKKFESHRDVIKGSKKGRAKWRVNRKNGEIEVDLEVQL